MGTWHDYDLIVIGAGIGGFVSAVTANSLGKHVAVVEKRRTGGNCTNFTCIPSKALIRLSHLSRETASLDRLGLRVKCPGGIDTEGVMARIRSVVQKAYEKDLPDTFERIGIHMLSGTAAFADNHHIEVDGRVLSAEKFIIAVGTRPLVPPIDGLAGIDYLTNETLYELDSLPGSLVILGGGVDGIEYASAFGRLGVTTTVVEMATRLIPTADREITTHLLRALRADGINLITGAKAKSLSREEDGVALMYEDERGQPGKVLADRVLVAIGRKPDLEGLSLEKAGVKYTARGIIADDKLRTSAPNIYGCGDIVGPFQLASTAEYHGMIAATNAMLPIKRRVDYHNNVYVIFTDPPLAYLGLTEEEAHAKYGHELQVYRFDYTNMRRALVDGEEVGMAKFLCDGRGRLVGAHILGEAASEVIHEAQVIKAMHRPLHKLHNVTHAYPTYAQALVGRASQLAYLDRMAGNVFVRTVLRLLPGYANRLNLARDRLAETPPMPSDGKPATSHPVIGIKTVADGKVWVVSLPVELLDHGEESLLASLGKDSKGPESIALDWSQVRRMNGLGAGMLVKVIARARRKGQRLVAFGLAEGLKDVLEVTELDQAIEVFPSEFGALSALGVDFQGTPPEEPFHAGITVDTHYWAKPTDSLIVPLALKKARNLNVNGRRPVGPVNGFGQLWQKTYWLHVSDPEITPEYAIACLKHNFPGFQPSYNHFFPSPAGIVAGEIVLLHSSTPGGPLSTGVMVLYADDRSFTFCCPKGHPESGFVSFSAFEAEGKTIVQIMGLARASDPIYEIAFHLVGSKIQARIWAHVLASLAAYLGVPASIASETICVDHSRQWRQFGNVWYNAQVRTLAHEPVRWLGALVGGVREAQVRSV
ncbi:MAG TPA: FAD-dependent oxidoreductase [Syntrophorhabdaceae bacterium]|jgi:pyruvate/2-oxoglutarate dehydrogenase complex dihydrolipoamide dehydrogenase (E3) component/anti-anti-sigma regulatory factor